MIIRWFFVLCSDVRNIQKEGKNETEMSRNNETQGRYTIWSDKIYLDYSEIKEYVEEKKKTNCRDNKRR